MDRKSIGSRLRKLRVEFLQLSQKELAERLGIKQNTLSNWERGEREMDYEAMQKLSELFNVNLHWLLTGEGEMFINKEGHSGIPSDRANIHPELYNFLALLPEEQQKQLASVFKEVLKSSSALSSGHTSPLQQERQADGGRIVEEE